VNEGCNLQLKAVEEAAGGKKISIVVEEVGRTSLANLTQQAGAPIAGSSIGVKE
jgi:hypothetical protein